MHNNKYLPLTGYLLCCSELYIIQPEIFEIFQKYFRKYFMKYFKAKNFTKFEKNNNNSAVQSTYTLANTF